MTTEPPPFWAKKVNRMVGKKVLVGKTCVKEDGSPIDQTQYEGLIEAAHERRGFAVRRSDSGEVEWLPPDLRAFKEAAPGEYRLRSTGEIVVDPDYLATWTITKSASSREPAGVSDENVEVVRRWFDALQQGDPAPELCDPEIEIRNWTESPITGPYHGHDGVQRWWEQVGDAFAELQWELQSIEPIDDHRCLTVQRLYGRFRHTGIETDFAWGSIVSVRDGKILSAVGYPSPRRARRAAGLD
jgi:ketosteroid isomerase-like protein